MRFALPLVAVALVAQVAQAQPAAGGRGTTLTLDEAISLARRNNPVYLQTVNARRSADAEVRTAYAAFLPSVFASLGGRYQQTGQQFVSGIALESSSDVVQSSYGLNLNYSISSDVLFAPKVFRAQRDAAEADVTGMAEVVRSLVTQRYIEVLQSQARAVLQDTLVLTTKGQLELAKARQAVGAATILEVRTAEVALGRAEVATLQAQNAAEVAMLRLFEQLGVAQPTDVTLSTRFEIAPVNYSLDSLIHLAKVQNPGIVALRSRERAAGVSVHGARGRYLPTLNLNTGWGGYSSAFTNESVLLSRETGAFLGAREGCFSADSVRAATGMDRLPCGALTFTAADTAGILARNNRFPFQFDRAPMSFSASISMPIFNNLQREQQLQQAIIQRDNAKFNVRARELQLTANVTEAHRNLLTAMKTMEMQETNAALAREQLTFAEERYRVGAATFLEVTTSRGTFEQAQIDRLNAIYDYHRTFAALESAVGRPLR